MTREEAQAVIQALVTLRNNATDEQALKAPAIYPRWKADAVYITGQRVLYEDVLYKVLQDHTSQEQWTPTDAPSLFAKVLIPSDDVIPQWEQPDSTNGYMIGDKVSYNGVIYISTVDNNVWKPTDYGWEVVE